MIDLPILVPGIHDRLQKLPMLLSSSQQADPDNRTLNDSSFLELFSILVLPARARPADSLPQLTNARSRALLVFSGDADGDRSVMLSTCQQILEEGFFNI
jgi:hypothetical protein